MYNAVTLKKYLVEFFGIESKEVYSFDNANGRTGFRISGINAITRKEIREIEAKTDLFLDSIELIED